MTTMEIWTYRDSSLRGLDLTGFDVETVDGVVGRVERVATEATGGYLVVDAGTLAPSGARVLVPVGVIETVDLDAERVFVRLTRDQIRSAPEYDWQAPLDASRRDQFAEHYGAGRTETQAVPELRAVPGSRTATTRTESEAGRRSRSSAPAQDRSKAGTERTKQELYDEARKLGIDGRSKMSKAQLARAIERQRGSTSTSGSSAKANPIEVQKFLEGVGYPTGKRDLVSEAEKQGASSEVRKTLERLPDKRFKTPTDVSEAIGKLR